MDAAAAIALLALALLPPLLGSLWWPDVPYPWAGLLTQAAASLLALRRSPVTTLLLTGAATALLAANALVPGATLPPQLALAPWLAGAVAVAATMGTGALWWTLAACSVVLSVRPWQPELAALTAGLVVTAAPLLLGRYLLTRRRLHEAEAERALREADDTRQRAAQARAQERVRLAGEMHDVLTHRVSLMVLQAGALRMTAPDDASRQAAEDLRAAGCHALDELRDLVGVLRTLPAKDVNGDAPVEAPATALPDLSALVAETVSVGIGVDLIEDGSPVHTSPVVGRTAFRIVQEALANVRKHAPGTQVRVHVRYGADRVWLSIRNTAPAVPQPLAPRAVTSGGGLLGLRQRVALVSGTINAGPRPDGGYSVDAILPAYMPTATPDLARHAR
ncbi:signal transduction histidine kinase [Crossiella equi]|uniref:histidine kinase n=1 Tax=Crossiella equi TaxID=130796 RepID=A0ABS5A8K0_9PSEU|nr:histidine kinase [Crossiella equi]MBP2472030.1 signal transduction histidine kinase [Crossiella equi]